MFATVLTFLIAASFGLFLFVAANSYVVPPVGRATPRHLRTFLFIAIAVIAAVGMSYGLTYIFSQVVQRFGEFDHNAKHFARNIDDVLSPRRHAPETPTDPDDHSLILKDQLWAWHRANKPLATSGWHLQPTEVKYDSLGVPGYEGPVMNCDFMEGYVVTLQRDHGWDFGYSQSITLFDSTPKDLKSYFQGHFESTVVNRATGLLYLRTTHSKHAPDQAIPLGFTLTLRPPIPQKEAVNFIELFNHQHHHQTVRLAYHRNFTPSDGNEEWSDWAPLPFCLDAPDGDEKLVVFEISVRLSPLLEAGQVSIATPLPNAQKLGLHPCTLALATDETELYRHDFIEPHFHLTSQAIRDTWDTHDAHQQATLRIATRLPLRVDLALRFIRFAPP